MSQTPSSASLAATASSSRLPTCTNDQTRETAALAQPERPWHRRAWEKFLTGTLNGLSQAVKLHPSLSYRRAAVERVADVPYLDSGLTAHRLDVYRPTQPQTTPRPALVYIHGGGFQLLSKETHWSLALRYAAQGFVVFNIEYRLAPHDPYPAAIQDAISACLWVQRHAAEYGADPSRIVLAGESAGANLATSVAVAASYQKTEPWARSLWDAAPEIIGVIASCGVLQVSDPLRLQRRRHVPSWIMRSVCEVADYLPNSMAASPGEWTLADPLCFLEAGRSPDRPLPPFFTFVGTKDPLLDDSRRLHSALDQLGAESQIKYYP